ncbi:LamG-like jellyroll fold domain-containing protein [Herbaspirillum seropedicae]|uniref:LamG-like jellyroll fold domain-containing protein n=1 Tax=Herbaspirillum seropedicae TaxID=964 RepID=UPI002864E36E|nr:LamG-like jellyroll fold domain-containing protein [Herbaspirillum seropedicae]MDR6394621.1 hypothetical protein [Herbaspirillum seropedicae]
MALLPNRNLFDGTKSPKPTTAEMKTAWATMRDYLAALLGSDSDDKPGARAALGVSSVVEVQAGKSVFAVATGTGDAMVVALTPTLLELVDGMELHVRCPGANAVAVPTLKVDALDPLPVVGSDGNPLAVGAYLANWPAIFRYRKPISSASASFELLNPAPVVAGAASSVRQTVLAGSVDANGYANMLSAGSGLSLALAAAATPMVLSFAGGYDATGEVNYLSRLTANVASVISGIAASNVSFILADYVSSTAVTWGKTLAPPQYGWVYSQSAQALLHFNGAAGATTFLDDFGNVWSAQGGARLQSNQVKFGATALGGSGAGNALNGTSEYVSSTGFTSLGSGAWAWRGHFWINSLGTTQGLMSMVNATGFGFGLAVTTGGKLRLRLSSTGTSFDIANKTSTGTSVAVNAFNYIEVTFDPVSGNYFVNLNGNQDTSLTTASSARLCGGTVAGVGADLTGPDYLAGYVDEFEFVPYCDHPGGVTYAVPTAAPSIASVGYASDFFNIVEMKMYRITGPSGAAGSNPTMTAAKRLYVGEVVAGNSSLVSVFNYALKGSYDSGFINTLPGINTLINLRHNIGVPPTSTDFIVKCLTSEFNMPVGEVIFDTYTAAGGSQTSKVQVRSQRNSASFTTGNNAVYAINKTTGGIASLTPANWAYKVVANRGW